MLPGAVAGARRRGARSPSEYDDYIARPEAQRLPVAAHRRRRRGRAARSKIQIRTRAMHEFAELGVAAHWRYKEGGKAHATDEQRVAWLRQLLAWRDEVEAPPPTTGRGQRDDRIYVLTPQARVVELPAGGTPIDFAYHIHSELGHRCRGAQRQRRDGAAEHAARERADGRGHRGQDRRAEPRLAQRGPRLPEERALAGQGAPVVQRARARAVGRGWARAGREGTAAARQDGGQARRPGQAPRLRQGRRAVRGGDQGGVQPALDRAGAGAARRGARADARAAGRQAARSSGRQGQGAGRRRRFAADAARPLLPPGAARRDRRLRHARPRRVDPPRSTARTCWR